MIDKNGKLFGKINVVDLLILLVIAALLVFAATKLIGNDEVTGSTQKVTITFYDEEILTQVTEKLAEGQPVWDYTSDVQLGTLKSFEVGPSVSYVLAESGNSVIAPKDGYRSVTLVAETEGVVTDYGVEVGGTLYAAGHTLIIYVGQAKFYLTVASVDAA